MTQFISNADMTDLRANPTHITTLYSGYRSAFITKLNGIDTGWTENQRKAAFCCVASYQAAPYGNSPTGWNISTLINATSLSCSGYVRLLWLLYQIMVPADVNNQIAGGVNGGAVGNHEQMFYPGTISVLLDPTIGLLWTGVTYDQLMSGHGYTSGWCSFYYRTDLNTFQTEVSTAIYYGQYKPSDALYYLPGIDNAQNNYGLYSPQRWIIDPP